MRDVDEPERPEPPAPEPSVTLTPVRAVVVAALLGGILAQLIVGATRALGWLPPHVSAITAVMFAALAVVLLGLALQMRRRVRDARPDITAPRAVGLLVLGKTALLAGAALSAGYLAYGLTFLGQWSASAPRQRVIASLLTAVAAAATAGAGWVLERACRVPPGAEDDEAGAS